MPCYKIIIGDNEDAFLTFLKNTLTQMGHEVLETSTSGTELLRKIRGRNPDIVIAEAALRGISGFEIGEILEGEMFCPCIVSFKGEPSQYKIKLSEKKIKTYLKKPLDYMEIEYILRKTIEDFERLIKEEKKLKEKKVVDRAKSLLMRKYNISEEDAYKYIRKKSMDKSTTMYKISLLIIDVINKKETTK